MNIDFHYGVIYLVGRMAGLEVADARIVAHACQYVDDASTDGILNFAGGESYERFASAHEMLDYQNGENHKNRLVWAPFHFLPAGQGATIEEKAICRPNSAIAQEMVRRAIIGCNAENSLHRLGITLHTYVDTWAHQGFAGMISEYNRVTLLVSEDETAEQWQAKILGWARSHIQNVESLALDCLLPVGHGTAGHYPDLPWANWRYTNGKGDTIHRHNLPDFIEATNMACKAVKGFLHGNKDYATESGLPGDFLTALQDHLGNMRSTNSTNRLLALSQAADEGRFPGIQETIPSYVAKGAGSWKHAATGLAGADDQGDMPEWSNQFEMSDYRKFHDASKQHRFVVTQEILPAFKVRLA